MRRPSFAYPLDNSLGTFVEEAILPLILILALAWWLGCVLIRARALALLASVNFYEETLA